MTQPLPFPKTLRAAVEAVIDQNEAVGYRPAWFKVRVKQATTVPKLHEACSNLILKPETLEWIEKSLSKHPCLLLLEDLVARHGEHYELGQDVIEEAQARVEWLDRLAGKRRFR